MNHSLCTVAFIEFAEFGEFIDSTIKAENSNDRHYTGFTHRMINSM